MKSTVSAISLAIVLSSAAANAHTCSSLWFFDGTNGRQQIGIGTTDGWGNELDNYQNGVLDTNFNQEANGLMLACANGYDIEYGATCWYSGSATGWCGITSPTVNFR